MLGIYYLHLEDKKRVNVIPQLIKEEKRKIWQGVLQDQIVQLHWHY